MVSISEGQAPSKTFEYTEHKLEDTITDIHGIWKNAHLRYYLVIVELEDQSVASSSAS